MVLVIDPQIAGIAGDMLLCSLVDIGADVEKIKKCASMGAQIAGTSIRKLEFSKVQKCGISATKLILVTDKLTRLVFTASAMKSSFTMRACKTPLADESATRVSNVSLNQTCMQNHLNLTLKTSSPLYSTTIVGLQH